PTAGAFILGSAFILIATIFWAVNIPVVKALIPNYMTADSITACRLIGGAALFWIASLFVKNDRIARQDWWRLITGGAIGLFAFIYLLNLSMKYANPIDVSIIMTLPPAFVILIGVIFQHRRPGAMEYLGIAIGFIGAFVVIVSGKGSGTRGSNELLGDLIALASTLCYSFYLVITERPSHTYHPVSMLRWTFLFGSVPALFLLGSFDNIGILHTADCIPWIEIGFIVLGPSFLAYFFLSGALKRIGSELVSLYQYLLPVFATIASVLMGLGHVKWMQVLAMLLIVAGMALTNIGKRRRTRATQQSSQQS
ncbi:MAG: DMT family transporter, partial [Muribaculaceae bacterium]|nr:DMT family transporter [Muribaculaceae bacterium]